MAKPIKIIVIVAITTYILPELLISSAISTGAFCCAKAVMKLASKSAESNIFFMLIYFVLFIFN